MYVLYMVARVECNILYLLWFTVLGEADGYSESVGDLPDISADQKQKSADQENEVKPKKKKKRRK